MAITAAQVRRIDFTEVAAAVALLNPHASGIEEVTTLMDSCAEQLVAELAEPTTAWSSAATLGFKLFGVRTADQITLIATVEHGFAARRAIRRG